MKAESECLGSAPRGGDSNVRAAAWIERKDREDWNDGDDAEFEAWLAASPANRAAYWRLDAVWKNTDRLVAFRRATSSAAPRQSLPVILRTVAAGMFLAILGVVSAAYLLVPRQQTIETAVGGHRVLILTDGSKIELNTDSIVRVSEDRSRRRVWLDKGEAYFEVTHNPARPFVVTAGDRRIVDLGTKFVVRRDSGRLRVVILDGRVRFEENDASEPRKTAVLKAGDVVVAAADSLAVTKLPTSELAMELGWRRGVVAFDNATLADVAAEFNRYNSTKLVVADKASAHIQIAGTFHANNLEAFVQTVQRVLMLHVEKRGDVIVISR